MGLWSKIYSSSSSFDMSHPTSRAANPNPNNYKIIKAEVYNNILVMWINYPDCKNYEGRKILVFDRGVTLIDVVNQKVIDPHFSNNASFISPIARFEPTDRGWQWAAQFANNF